MPTTLTTVASALLIVVALGGCSSTSTAPLGPEDVMAERAAVRLALEREGFDAFIERSGGRLAELGLPTPEFQGFVAIDAWDAAVTQCIEQLDPRLEVSRLEGGFTVNYFGLVSETYERIRWMTESCIAQYAIDDPRSGAGVDVVPGDRELAWRYQDVTQRVIPCLRGLGVATPLPPSLEEYSERFGTTREWTPFALAAPESSDRQRALALCPPSSTVLAAHADLGGGVAP